jgi:hypothetical protein
MATSVLDLILKQSETAQQATRDVEQVAKETFRGQEAIQGQISSIYDQVAQSVATTARQAQIAQIAVQDANRAAASAAGISADGSGGRIVDLLAKQRAAGDELLATVDEVERKRNRTVWDIVSDPINTIKDMVTLEDSENRLRTKVQKTQIIQTELIGANNALQETFQTQAALKQVSTAATADAAAQVAAAEAQILARKSQLEGLKYNLLGAQAIQQASVQTLELLGKSQNAIQAEQTMRIQNENLRINLAQLQIQKENARAMAEARAEAKGAKLEQQQFDKFLEDNITLSMKASGLEVPAGIGMKQIIAMYKAGDQSYMYHARNGQRIKATGGTTAYIGAEPAEAVEAIARFDLNLPKQMKPVTDILTRALADPALARVDRKKEPEKWGAEYNKTVGGIVANDFASVVPGSGNVFDIGGLEEYIKTPAIAALPLTQKFLAPMVAAGVPTNDPRTLLKAAAAAVAKGELTSSEFAQFAPLYQQASLTHQKAVGLDRVGIVPPMAGRQYNVPMGRLLGAGNLNLTDSTQLSRWLASNMSSELMKQDVTKRGQAMSEEFKAPFKRFFGDSYSNTIKNYQGQ